MKNTFIGSPVERREDLRFVRGRGQYVDDLHPDGLVYAVILRSLTLIGQLLDQFKGHERTTINQLVVSPDYIRLRAALIQALGPYPEARRAVAKVLSDLETVEVSDGAVGPALGLPGGEENAGNGSRA